MKRIVNLMLVLTLLLAMLAVGTLHAAAADPASAGETVECEQALYVETFEQYEASADTEAVLAALGWKKLLKSEGAENETNASFEIKDGKLYFTNLGDGYDGKDGYYEIAALSGEAMKDVFAQTYTVQYDVTYTAGAYTRYANFVTEYTQSKEDGVKYNTIHFRAAGYGNNQLKWSGRFYTYDAKDENDLYAAIMKEDPENGYTSICKKLLGQDVDTKVVAFLDVTVTVRVVYDLEKGPRMYMKTPEMDEFILVSQASTSADGLTYWKKWEGESVAFKIGAAINGYIDNVYMWEGDGDIVHNLSDWTVVSEADCNNKRVEKSTCSDCKMTSIRLVGEPLSHNWSDWTVVSEADCFSKCVENRMCSGCKSVETREVGEPLGHNWSDWTVSAEADCLNQGEEKRTCSGCTTVETRPVKALGHDFGEGLVCSRCEQDKYSQGLKYSLSKGKYTVTGIGTCTDTEIRIPATHEGKPVNEIAKNAFKNNTTITRVVIPEGVTTIGGSAFYGCSNLISVSIPDTVTNIGSAFTKCDNLVYNVDSTAKYLGNEKNPYLVLVKIIDTKITSFEFYPQTKIIDGGAFTSCNQIEVVDIPEGVVQIRDAFNRCTALKEVRIPASAENLSAQMFFRCNNLETLIVAEGHPTYHSTNNCIVNTGTKQLTAGCKGSVIPAGGEEVTTIYNNAFYTASFTIFHVPAGITEIKDNAFQLCFNLETMIIDATVTKIGKDAFTKCSELKTIYYTGTAEDWAKINIDATNPELLAAEVKYIGEWHIDIDQDHDCECGCDKKLGDHIDSDLDHACDYGCAELIGEHVDANKDHKCDHGCDKVYGEHIDANKDHACYYGCAELIGEHIDANKDHKCDYECAKLIGDHIDANYDHKCDYGCDVAIGEHADSAYDGDHVCDHGCGAVLEDCIPAEDDGDCTTDINCAICGTMLEEGEDSHVGGVATCAEQAKCDVCGTAYGAMLPHTPGEDDGDCTTDIPCTECGGVAIKGAVTHTVVTADDQSMYCSACGISYDPFVDGKHFTIDQAELESTVDDVLDTVENTLDSALDWAGENAQSAITYVYNALPDFLKNLLTGK